MIVETAVDVDNPLVGKHGASVVFGPQKGAGDEDVVILNAVLAHFDDNVAEAQGGDFRELPGSGQPEEWALQQAPFSGQSCVQVLNW